MGPPGVRHIGFPERILAGPVPSGVGFGMRFFLSFAHRRDRQWIASFVHWLSVWVAPGRGE